MHAIAFTVCQRPSSPSTTWRHGRASVERLANELPLAGIRSHQLPRWRRWWFHRPVCTSRILGKLCRLHREWSVSGRRILPPWCHGRSQSYWECINDIMLGVCCLFLHLKIRGMKLLTRICSCRRPSSRCCSSGSGLGVPAGQQLRQTKRSMQSIGTKGKLFEQRVYSFSSFQWTKNAYEFHCSASCVFVISIWEDWWLQLNFHRLLYYNPFTILVRHLY